MTFTEFFSRVYLVLPSFSSLSLVPDEVYRVSTHFTEFFWSVYLVLPSFSAFLPRSGQSVAAFTELFIRVYLFFFHRLWFQKRFRSRSLASRVVFPATYRFVLKTFLFMVGVFMDCRLRARSDFFFLKRLFFIYFYFYFRLPPRDFPSQPFRHRIDRC